MEIIKNLQGNNVSSNPNTITNNDKIKTTGAYIALVLLSITVCARIIISEPKNWEEKKEVDLSAIVIEFPYEKGQAQILKVKSTMSSDKNMQTITIYTKKYPQYQIKDSIAIKGKLGKNNTMYYPQIAKNGNSATGIEKKLFRIKESLQKNISSSMAEPYASITQGMLLGANTNIPQEIRQIMQRAGTMHMLVASGFNITMITAFILKTAGVIKRQSALIIAASAVVIFIIITGAQPPVLRAGIMGMLALGAQGVGRPVQGKRIFILTIIGMLILWPELFYSLSFQLSALATAGIIFISPMIATKSLKDEKNKFREYLITEGKTTISAQCAVIPLILNTFGNLSIIAPITNLATAWVVPYIMIGGFITGVAGYIDKNLANIFGAATTAITYIFLLIQEICTSLPFIYYENITINPVIIVGIYTIMAAMIIKFADKNKYSKKENEI